jgi:peptidoglycan hydrolase CwlO-like protein
MQLKFKLKLYFFSIFKLKVTEFEQRNTQSEINLKEATNEIESLRSTFKENDESLEDLAVSLILNISYSWYDLSL